MRKIKVLVIDDSAFMRRIISDIINEDDKCEVVATAKNGLEALGFIKKYKPDVMTLDVEMPLLNGIDVLKQIDKSDFVPTIMLSSTTKEGATVTIQALELGAIDFIKKPTNIFNVNSDEIRENIINKIITASKVRINKIYRSDNQDIKNFNIRNKNSAHTNMSNSNSSVKNIVAIGTSTGGPKALKSVLPLLPSNINASVVVVQHMPAGFTKSLAERLDSLSNMKIKEAEHGEVLLNGTAYIAPGGRHIAVNNENNKFVIATMNVGEKMSGMRVKDENGSEAMFNNPLIMDIWGEEVVRDFYDSYSEVREVLYEGHASFYQMNNFGDLSKFRDLFADNIKKAFDAGVLIAGGTDAPAYPSLWAGETMHRELELFVMAGIPPLDAIKMCTYNAAKILKDDDKYGSLQEGLIADIVLVSGKPWENISDTRNIEMVVVNGKILDRKQLLSSWK